MELVLHGMTSGIVWPMWPATCVIVNPALGQIFGVDVEQLRGGDWR